MPKRQGANGNPPSSTEGLPSSQNDVARRPCLMSSCRTLQTHDDLPILENPTPDQAERRTPRVAAFVLRFPMFSLVGRIVRDAPRARECAAGGAPLKLREASVRGLCALPVSSGSTPAESMTNVTLSAPCVVVVAGSGQCDPAIARMSNDHDGRLRAGRSSRADIELCGRSLARDRPSDRFRYWPTEDRSTNLAWLGGVRPPIHRVGVLPIRALWTYAHVDQPPGSPGLSISWLDSIPLMAVLLRPLSAVLPESFQYMGIWACLCFGLQAYFALRLGSLLFPGQPLFVLGAALLLTGAPAAMYRMFGHHALASHWLILAALWCIPRTSRIAAWRWLLPFGTILALAGSVSPYHDLCRSSLRRHRGSF